MCDVMRDVRTIRIVGLYRHFAILHWRCVIDPAPRSMLMCVSQAAQLSLLMALASFDCIRHTQSSASSHTHARTNRFAFH